MNKNGRKKIARINELYKKSKTPAGLTSVEKEEQKNLRQEYIFAMKQNLRSVLNNIDIKEPDGSITRLEDIDPTKKYDGTDKSKTKKTI